MGPVPRNGEFGEKIQVRDNVYTLKWPCTHSRHFPWHAYCHRLMHVDNYWLPVRSHMSVSFTLPAHPAQKDLEE